MAIVKTKKTKLTEEDISCLQYFHQEKRDMTRWVGWEEAAPLIKEQYPHLWDAHQRMLSAERTLDIIVKSLDEMVDVLGGS